MRKLVVQAFVTLDGVMQAPGGAGEDPSGGFSYEGWLVPFFDEETGAQINEWFSGVEDFLLGRGTYEIFYASWPKMLSDDPVSQAINHKPKYVASRTLTSVEWETAELLGDDVPGAIRALKDRDGGELQVHGSAGLIQTLLAEDLVDELRLLVVPVVLGSGKRLFADGTIPRSWRLVSSTITPRGAFLGSYERTGEVETGYVGPDLDTRLTTPES
jgi:dihydrofolate reductase